MDENNRLPAGWGDAEDEDDYGYEEDKDFPWGVKSDLNESTVSENAENSDMPDDMQTVPKSGKIQNGVPTQPVAVEKKSPLIAILVGIIVVLAAGGGVLGGILLSKGQDNTADNMDETELPSTDSLSMESMLETEMVHDTSTIETETTVETVPCTEEMSHSSETMPSGQEQTSYTNADLHIAYANIASEIAPEISLSGIYLTDLDGDGYDEMILPEPATASFRFYYYSDNQISSHAFGSYQALGNFVLYEVSGENGSKYIYYRDEYSYRSLQGYYDWENVDSLNIRIDYPFDGVNYYAEWEISSNDEIGDTVLFSGYEQVTAFYAQPIDCHAALLSAFDTCGYAIHENSKYTKIASITLDELKGNGSAPTEDSVQSTVDLGKMYNLFHFRTLALSSKGCLYDVNGDGVEELILLGYGDCYCIYTFQNGELSVTYDYMKETVRNDQLLAHEQISGICREKAVENGFSLNNYFVTYGSVFGYIATEGGTLNLRAAPSKEAEVVTEVPYGTFFNVYDDPTGMIANYWEDPEWYYIGVMVNGTKQYGYVSSDYVSVVDTSI